MLVITPEKAFLIAMLIFSVVGMVYGIFKMFPAIKDNKFFQVIFQIVKKSQKSIDELKNTCYIKTIKRKAKRKDL